MFSDHMIFHRDLLAYKAKIMNCDFHKYSRNIRDHHTLFTADYFLNKMMINIIIYHFLASLFLVLNE